MKLLPLSYTEERLVTELKQGSAKAYSLLYDQYAPTLFGIISRIVCDKEVAQDVLQDVFIKIHQKINYYDNTKGRLFTWLLTIARNTAFDEARPKQLHLSISAVDIDSLNGQYHITYNSIDGIGLSELIHTLPGQMEKIFELIYFEGHTQIEVATMMDIPLGTVKTKIRTGLQKLRMNA